MATALDPLFAQAKAQRQSEQDAIARMLEAQAAKSAGLLGSTAENINAPSEALAAVNSIPQSMAQTIQTQQVARRVAGDEALAGQQLSANQGLTNMQNFLAESGKIQSNMDALRQQWAQSDLASKMNLAQESGKNRLKELEALQQQAQQEAMYRAQEHAYRMASAGGRGGSGGSDSDWTNTAAGQRLLYDIQMDQAEGQAEQAESVGKTQQAIWNEYAALRESGVGAGDAWRRTLEYHDALGSDAISRQIQDYVRRNAQRNFPAKGNAKPSILNWGERLKWNREHARPGESFWTWLPDRG